MSNIFELADLWNNPGTIFSAIKMTVTNTASAAGSMLLDLRVEAAKKFAVVAADGGFQSWNTYTDEANYERIYGRWSSNEFLMTTQAAGSGTVRGMTLRAGSATTPGGLRFISSAVICEYSLSFAASIGGSTRASFYGGADNILTLSGINGATGGAFEMLEMTAPAAPAANRVRLYSQDNGSGKTQLMALFPTGAAQQVAIEP